LNSINHLSHGRFSHPGSFIEDIPINLDNNN
jgi:hypothetical protein